MTPAGLPPSRMGAPQKHLAGRGGMKVTPRRSRAFSRSERISSGWPVRRMYSVRPLASLRERLGKISPFSTSNSKRISSPSWNAM